MIPSCRKELDLKITRNWAALYVNRVDDDTVPSEPDVWMGLGFSRTGFDAANLPSCELSNGAEM